MHHTRTIGRLLVGVLAALTLAIVGTTTPAWAAEETGKGTQESPYVTWEATAKAVNAGDGSSVWISVGSGTDDQEGNSIDITKGSATLNILCNNGTVELPQISAGSTNGSTTATLNIRISNLSEGISATTLNFGEKLIAKKGSSIDISSSVDTLETVGLGSTATTIGQGSNLALSFNSSKATALTLGSETTVNAGGTLAFDNGANQALTVTTGDSVTLSSGASATTTKGSIFSVTGNTTLKLAVTESLQVPGAAESGCSGATLFIGKDATLNIDSKNIETTAGTGEGTPGGPGIVDIDGNLSGASAGAITNGGTFTVDGKTTGIQGAIANNGTLTFNGAMTSIQGAITNNENATLEINNSIETSGAITNACGSKGGSLAINGSIASTGSIKNNSGKMDITVGGTVKPTTGAAVTIVDGVVTINNLDATGGGSNGSGISISTANSKSSAVVVVNGGVITGGSATGSAIVVSTESGGAATLTLTGVKANGTGAAGLTVTGAEDTDENLPTITISDGTVISGKGGITVGDGESSKPGSINVTGNNVVINGGEDPAVTLNENSTMTVSGTVSLSGTSESGLINVNDGTLTVTGSLTSDSGSPIIQLVKGTVDVNDSGNISNSTSTVGDGKSVGVEVKGGTLNLNDYATVSGRQYGVAISGGDVYATNNSEIETTGATSSCASLNITGGIVHLLDASRTVFPSKGSATAIIASGGTGNVYAEYWGNTGGQITDPKNYNLHYENAEEGPQPTPPSPPEPPATETITVKVDPNNGTAASTNTYDLDEEGYYAFKVPAAPTYAGHYFIGWFNGSNRVNANSTINLDEDTTITARWANVTVTMDPASTVVAPGGEVSIKVTTKVTAVDSGFSVPSSPVLGTPTVTTNPVLDPAAAFADGTITFTAPTTQPQTITVGISYLNATNVSTSGYGTATVTVATASAVTAKSANSTGGTATAGTTVNAQGLVTISATPSPTYSFIGWTFSPAQGVTWKPSDAGLNMMAASLNVPTYAGTWTANFAQTVKVYRLYNTYDKTHLYTTDVNEYNTLVAIEGWNDEGVAWNAPKTGTGAYTIIRLYNKYNGDHYYLPKNNTEELNILLKAGWTQDSESSWFDSMASTSQPNYPVFQLFNPYRNVDTHLWTMDEGEVQFNLTQGWKQDTTTIWAASPAV